MAIFGRKPKHPKPKPPPVPDRRTAEVLGRVDQAVDNLHDALAEWRSVRDELSTRQHHDEPEGGADGDA